VICKTADDVEFWFVEPTRCPESSTIKKIVDRQLQCALINENGQIVAIEVNVMSCIPNAHPHP
jgi:hypothetical protein